MRPVLLSAAALFVLASPAGAATLTVAAGPNSNFANQACDGPGQFTGSTVQRITRTCARADVGEATGQAVASVGHLGASSVATSHNDNSLGAGIGAEAAFQDVVMFTSTDPFATGADVSLNLLLEGVLEKSQLFDAASLEAFVILQGQFTKLAMSLNGDGFTVRQDDFSTSGVLGPVTHATLTTPTVHVSLNTPILLRMNLQVGTGVGGPHGFARADFGDTFKFPTGDVFNLPDGVTVNAGDYLVDNRFIDPLATAGGVPEPASWAMMIVGFGLSGAVCRRRRRPARA